MTTKRDVNAEFAAEKIDQLARQRDEATGLSQNRRRDARLSDLQKRVETGEMTRKDNADGSVTFRVVAAGWDFGETWNVSAAKKLDMNATVEANHGLEIDENGNVSLYLKDSPAWHSLGTVIPGGLSDMDAVLRAGGLDWNVEKRPIRYLNPITSEMETFDREYTTHRMDTGKALGRVGEIYTPLQNSEAYEMLDEIIGLGMVCESAGVLAGGSRVFVTCEIPETVKVDPDGLADDIRQFLAIMNSHDGKTPLLAVVTPWRVACGNTHRFAVRDAVYKWKIRHTRNAKTKIDEARRALGLTVEYYQEFAAEGTALVHTPVSSDDVEALISELFPLKLGADGQPSKRGTTLDITRSDKIHELFAYESNRVGRNAYALENAVTGYVDHFADLRPRAVELKGNRLKALGDAIMSESNDEIKNKTHAKLLELRVR